MYLKIIWYFFKTNIAANPWYLGAIFSWIIGLILQKLLGGIIIAAATDQLLALSITTATDLWAIFSPYIFAIIATAIGGQWLIDIGFFGVARTVRAATPIIHREVFAWLLRQKLAYYADNFTGSITSQVTKFFASHMTFSEMIMLNVVRMLVVVFVAIFITAWYSPLIASFLFGWAIVFLALVRTTTKLRMKNHKRETRAHNNLIGHIADVVGNISIVMAYARHHYEKQRNHSFQVCKCATNIVHGCLPSAPIYFLV